jgi:hypothetical protein
MIADGRQFMPVVLAVQRCGNKVETVINATYCSISLENGWNMLVGRIVIQIMNYKFTFVT